MSKEEETRDKFFEYLMALNAIGSDAEFLSKVESLDPPLETGFWDSSEEEEEKELAKTTLDKNGLTISKTKNPDTGIKNQNKTDISGVVELDEETMLSDSFVEDLSERLGLTRLRENNEDLNEKTRLIYEETKSLNERMDYLNGGRDLSEEKMKEAVRDGVTEALQGFIEDLKSQGTSGFFGGGF